MNNLESSLSSTSSFYTSSSSLLLSSSSSTTTTTTTIENEIERVNVTIYGTKLKKKYTCKADVVKKKYENDAPITATSDDINKQNESFDINTPKLSPIVIENIKKINIDGSISLHPLMGELSLSNNFNFIDAIEKYYAVVDDEKDEKEKNINIETQVSVSSSPSSGETTVQSIESVDINSTVVQTTPQLNKPSLNVIDTATFWDNIESQNYFAPYNKKLIDAGLELFKSGGDYEALKIMQEKIQVDDEGFDQILLPNTAHIEKIQNMANSDKMSFFYKRLVACLLLPKSKKNELRELNKNSKIVDSTTLTQTYDDPEHIIKVWPVQSQLGCNIENNTMNKIINKRTYNEFLNVGIIRPPNENMTLSEKKAYEDNLEMTRDDDELGVLVRSNIQDLKRIEMDLNTKIINLKKNIGVLTTREESKAKLKREEQNIITKYNKIKKK